MSSFATAPSWAARPSVSYIIDVAIDGCSVEVAACVGHLFPLSDVTFLDDDAPV